MADISPGNRGLVVDQGHGAGVGPNRRTSVGTTQRRLTCELPADLHKRSRRTTVATARHTEGPLLIRGLGFKSLAARPFGLTWPFVRTGEGPESSSGPGGTVVLGDAWSTRRLCHKPSGTLLVAYGQSQPEMRTAWTRHCLGFPAVTFGNLPDDG
jgi:hypothetical protein